MILKLEELTKLYKDKVALDGVSFSFSPGIYGLLGPNGAGKSTMMNLITDNLTPTKGCVLLNERSIDELGSEYRKLLGYMPQQQNIYPELSLRRFLYFMASLKGLKKEEAEKDINHYVRMVRLEDVLGKKLGTFSGGMKQRALIAQALIGDPGILILDEPTAGLDPKGRDEILDQIAYLHKSCDMTVILVSHSMEDIAKYVDRIIVMNHGSMLFDDVPKKVFEHYKELEQVGLSAPQVTYIMHELRERGLEVPVNITTIEEATDAIVAALAKKNEKRGQ